MKHLILSICITLLLASCSSVEKYNQQITKLHSVEDLRKDTDKMYNQLKRLHPKLYQFTPKETLDFKFDSLKAAITSPMTSREFYKKLATVTKYVGQGHMTIAPPSKRFKRKERLDLIETEIGVKNLTFEYLDDKLFVTKVKGRKSYKDFKRKLLKGKDSLLLYAEVLEIEGKKPQDLIKEYKKVIVSDGYNTTFHDRIAGLAFMRYYSNHNERFDSISFKFRNADSTFTKTFKRELKHYFKPKDSTKIDSLNAIKKNKRKLTKAERKANKIKFKKEQKERSKYGYNYKTYENTRDLSFVGKDNSVALMTIKGFEKGKYKLFYDEVFTTLDSLKTKNLIIDLRNNLGGRLTEISYLYTYLTDKNFTMINLSEVNTRLPFFKILMSNSTSLPVKLVSGLLSPAILTHNLIKTKKKDGKLYYKFKQSKEQEPHPLNFKGQIYVLINGNSFSASSILSAQLHGDKRAIFVGEETGGAYNGTVAGAYKIYTLPNTKVKARIGLMHIDSKHKEYPDGYGVKPDVEILPTYKDRLNAIDPELDWVLKDIKAKSN